MTDAGWAEKAVAKRLSDGWSGDAWVMGPGEAADMLRKEHARSVRLVKRELRLMESHILNDEQAGNEDGLAIHRYAASVLTDLLTALQRGRGGKG